MLYVVYLIYHLQQSFAPIYAIVSYKKDTILANREGERGDWREVIHCIDLESRLKVSDLGFIFLVVYFGLKYLIWTVIVWILIVSMWWTQFW